MFPRVAFASAPTDKRLVVIMLRGALDGLYAVPAYGDPDYYDARKGIGTPKPGEKDGALKLDGFFGLHPNLTGLQSRYAKGELAVLHAVSSPYRGSRSHFDAQNLLENGSDKPYGLTDGWLNRSLLGLPTVLSANRPDLGVALSPTMPVMLRGPAHVTSWSPSSLPEPDADIVGRLQTIYDALDPRLATALAGAAEAHVATMGSKTDASTDPFVTLMAATAKFLTASNGPCVAMADSGGWDSHANQTNPFTIPRNLLYLDKGIEALATGMGAKWNDTAVLVMTEFGRTVAQNGTSGTDHGTGAAAFLVGGAVKGGRVIADWPGLKPANLFEGRDLMPTNNLYSVAKGVLRDHMQVEPAHIEKVVFPDSAAAKPMDGLMRT
jgi:uncharacterized protein (DUF1501 family)